MATNKKSNKSKKSKKAKSAPKKRVASNKAATAKKAATANQAAATGGAAPAAADIAPAFTLRGDDGASHSLADHAGAPVVLYFYPRDDTPGCTIEACDFRDNLARAAANGAVVLGVSKDSLPSHTKFREKYSLNFPLLSDPDLTVHKAYGAWGEKLMYGKPTVGVIRSTFLVGRDGRIARAWPRVKIDGHVDEVLRALEALG